MAAALAGWLGGIALFYIRQLLPALSGLGAAALIVFLVFKKQYFVIALIIAGFIWAMFSYEPPPTEIEGEFVLKGVAAPARKLERGTFSQGFHILEITPGPRTRGYPAEVRLQTEFPLRQGRLYEIKAEITPAEGKLNPEAFVPKPRAKLLEIIDERPAGFVERARGRLNEFYMGNFPPRQAGFLMSVTTGERALLGGESWRIFGNAGLAHLLSISGTHFGIFGLFVFAVIGWALRALPLKVLERLTLHISPRQLSALLSLPLLSFYLLISGGRIPAVRSFVMMALFLAGLLIGRKRAWLHALFLAAALILLWQPAALLDLSFQFSFLAVFFIGLFVSDGGEKEEEGRPFIKKYASGSLRVTLSATLGVLPLAAYYFHQVPIISPLANFVVVPIVGFLLVPAAVLAGLVYLATGWYALSFLVAQLSDVTLWLAGFFSSIPYSSIPVRAFPPGLALITYGAAFFLYKKNKRLVLLSFVPLLLWAGGAAFKDPPLRVTFLDAGRGESSVVELPDGKTLVIDTGAGGYETASHLRRIGKRRIDTLALSHAHRDHTGGAAHLIQSFEVTEIWDNGRLLYEGDEFEGVSRRKLSRGDYFEHDDGEKGYRITVLHPREGFLTQKGQKYVSENNDSLVLKVEDSAGRGMLFCGDAELEAQQDMLAIGAPLKTEALKVAHHGSKRAAHPPFVSAVSPKVALIAAAEDNPSGHPHPEALEALLSARVYRTDTDGAIQLTFPKDKNKPLSVKTYSQMELRKFPPSCADELHNLKMLFSSW